MRDRFSSDRAHVLAGARVLVVEDDFLLLMELETVLSEAGAENVLACRTIDEALALADTAAFAVAVLDVRIGHHSIAPVARRLVARGTPFVFYTGQAGDDRIMREWPQCRIVSKPAQPRILVAAVSELLDQYRAGERATAPTTGTGTLGRGAA